MSANLIVDIANTCIYAVSVSSNTGVGDTPASGLIFGEIVDLQNAGINTQVFGAVGPTAGALVLGVQTSDALTSGSFTDPTSGLAQLPDGFVSGGFLVLNSGTWPSGNMPITSPVNNARPFCSGGIGWGHFQRPHRYARLIASGLACDANVMAGFLGNKPTTGSGGGFTLNPGSGTVNV